MKTRNAVEYLLLIVAFFALSIYLGYLGYKAVQKKKGEHPR